MGHKDIVRMLIDLKCVNQKIMNYGIDVCLQNALSGGTHRSAMLAASSVFQQKN